MKKLLGIIMSALLLFTAAACTNGGGNENGNLTQLATPQNLRVTSGVIYWDAVPNATGYTVTYNQTDHAAATPQHTITPVTMLQSDFDYTVVATAEGYLNSEAASGSYVAQTQPQNISVEIVGNAIVGSGQSADYTAVVSGDNLTDRTVTWSIQSGSEYASVDNTGKLKASTVTGAQTVVLKATSNADGTTFATKNISVQPKPALTQDMLSRLTEMQAVEFSGSMLIELYSKGLHQDLVSTLTYNLKAEADGADWHAEYTDMLDVTQHLYTHNNNGNASNVTLSFTNEEEYTDILDDNGEAVTWEASGYYNNFYHADITPDDFEFDYNLWRYMYVPKGESDTFMQRVVASANPYEFTPASLGLDISGGIILGIYAASTRDRGIVAGYDALMYMTVLMSEATDPIPKITVYKTTEASGTNPGHAPLTEAIANMQALTSYQIDYYDIASTAYGTTSYFGYTETVTSDTTYYRSFSFDGNFNKTYTGSVYGSKAVGENLYNSYDLITPAQGEPYYAAYRAFRGDISEAKPGFEFAAEIFTSYSKNDDGSITYYADPIMAQVATEFYYSADNDSELLGVFASTTQLNNTQFSPNVTIKDGRITEAEFYYYMGIMWGVVRLEYSQFNEATLPGAVEFEQRPMPTSWEGFSFADRYAEDATVSAAQTFQTYFAGLEIPFFGDALGDTFGFGAWGIIYRPSDSKASYPVLALYYDVPLDLDYTLTSSYDALHSYLKDNGFTHHGNFEYRKGDLGVKITEGEDEGSEGSLDFYVYIWNYNTAN